MTARPHGLPGALIRVDMPLGLPPAPSALDVDGRPLYRRDDVQREKNARLAAAVEAARAAGQTGWLLFAWSVEALPGGPPRVTTATCVVADLDGESPWPGVRPLAVPL